MKRVLGALLLATPVCATIAFHVYVFGVLMAATMYTIASVAFILIVSGLALLTSDET